MPKNPRPTLSGNLPPGIEPRGLSKLAAAEYVGCSTVSAFEDRVRRGILPGPVPGTKIYDRKALDAALDKLSGIVVPGTRESEAEAALRAWQAEQDQAAARTERQLRGSLNPAHKRRGASR